MNKGLAGCGCTGILMICVANLVLGCWSVIEILSWFGKSIPFLLSLILGLMFGEATIPIAVIGKILFFFFGGN